MQMQCFLVDMMLFGVSKRYKSSSSFIPSPTMNLTRYFSVKSSLEKMSSYIVLY